MCAAAECPACRLAPGHLVRPKPYAFLPWLQHANWRQQRLSRLALIGTSLQSLSDSALLFQALTQAPAAALAPDAPHTGLADARPDTVSELARRHAVVEKVLPDLAMHGIATSLHMFPRQRLAFLPA